MNNLIRAMFLTAGIRNFVKYKIVLPLYYKKCCRALVERSFVFCYEGEGQNASFDLLIPALKQNGFTVVAYFCDPVSFAEEREFFRHASRAHFVLTCTSHRLLDKVELRKESKVINIWHGCGAFKKWGWCDMGTWGGTRRQKKHKHLYRNIDLVPVSSPNVIPYYAEAFGKDAKIIVPLGVSRTDMYFDKKLKIQSIAKVRQYLLALGIEGKKIIAYMPTFRSGLDGYTSPDFLCLENLSFLRNEYVILIKKHPYALDFVYTIPPSCAGFVYDATDKLSILDLTFSADIIITDYSSLIFEASLFDRPILFFAPDLEEYTHDRGFFIDYKELASSALCLSTEDVSHALNGISGYDMGIVRYIRETYMKSCDGKSTQRLIEYMKNWGKV